MLLREGSLLKFMLILYGAIDIERREAYLDEFITLPFNAGLHSDVYKRIYFKHGMVI